MAGDLIGETLGQFRIVAKLGQGGMGVVYRAIEERGEPAWSGGEMSWGRAAALAAERRAGRVTDAQVRATMYAWRREWAAGGSRLSDTGWANYSHWQSLYGWVRTPSEVREAMAHFDASAPLPRRRTDPWGMGNLGRAYALAGDAAHAIPLLQGAVLRCGEVPAVNPIVPIDSIMDKMHNRLLLGQMLEQTSDRDQKTSSKPRGCVRPVLLRRWVE